MRTDSVMQSQILKNHCPLRMNVLPAHFVFNHFHRSGLRGGICATSAIQIFTGKSNFQDQSLTIISKNYKTVYNFPLGNLLFVGIVT